MFTWPTSLKYPESKPSTPLTPLKYPESMSKYNEATAEVYLDMDEGYLSEVARGEKQVHRGDSRCVLGLSVTLFGLQFYLSNLE